MLDFLPYLPSAFAGLLGGTAGAVAVLVFLAKKLVDHNYAKAAAEHKTQLEKEKLRYVDELKQFSFVSQTKFARLHEKRIAVFEDFNEQLAGLMKLVFKLSKNSTQPDFDAVTDSHLEAWKRHCSKQFFVSKELSDKMYEALRLVRALGVLYETRHDVEKQGERWQEFDKEKTKALEKITDTMVSLDAEVRAILATDESKT